MRKEWKEIFKIMDEKEIRLSENDVLSEVQSLRKEKRSFKSPEDDNRINKFMFL